MRVVLMGSYPTYPFRKELNLRRDTRHVVTSWNVNLSRALAKLRGVEVHFITFAPIPEDKVVYSEGVNFYFIKFPKFMKAFDLFSLFQLSRIKIHKLLSRIDPDIVHGIGTEHLFPYIAITSNYPSLITVHGIMSEIVKRRGISRLSYKKAIARLERYVLKKAKRIISISPYVEETLKGHSSAKFYRVENAVEEVFFNTYSSQDTDKLLFIGMIQKGKGLLDLLKAIKIVRGWSKGVLLEIIGPVLPNQEKYYGILRRYMEEEDLEPNIKFLGYMDRVSVAQKLAESAMLILPSVQETAPMVIAEAMAVGKPVVATRVGGVPYMVNNGETGFLVEVGDVEGLADKILELLKNKDLRIEMGRRAKEEALRRFHPSVVAWKTKAIYEEILAKGGV
ncbi:MAG: hypothetical protein DRG83_01185 [Deltaproteobacteria bacterium]|nr:MAG: hypothetical protein DRG83_01185 [Deltaproteobacteria bacterium]